MLVNKKDSNTTSRVKFISYNGKYPCLCTGVLTLEIDGVQYKFGNEDEADFNSFWITGGSIAHDSHWNWDVRHGEWKIDVERLPEQFRELASEIDAVFNENVPYGCCGGCI